MTLNLIWAMSDSLLGLFGLNGGGLVLILVIILFLSANFLFSNELRDLIRGLAHGIDEIKRESSRICDEISPVI
jgi:Sec-independent protein translocase protein TatA